MYKDVVLNSTATNNTKDILVYFLTISFSVMLGSVSNVFVSSIVFIFIGCLFLRNFNCFILACISIILSSLYISLFNAYAYFMLFFLYVIALKILKLLNFNTYKYSPYVSCVLGFMFSIYLTYDYNLAFSVVIVSLLLVSVLSNDYHYSIPNILNRNIISLIIFSIVLVFNVLTNNYYIMESYFIFLIIISLLLNTKDYLLLLLCIVLLNINVPSSWYIIFSLVNVCKSNKLICILGIGYIGYLYGNSYNDILLYASVMIFSMLYKEKVIEKDEHSEVNRYLNAQINNYANIFLSLSQFYKHKSDLESEVLISMSDALCYSAYTIRNNEYIYQANENKLINVLKAYHYEFTRFKYEESNNIITLNINLKNISRSEIRDNLIPLLENIIDNKFMIEEDTGNSLGNSFHRLKLKTIMPYKVETSGSSLKNYNHENGDNYSIFNYKQYAVCIISDGMGNSLIANETSRCITNIFQRMIQSNIAIDQAIKCINKLIHSDEYATVDIISFDQINGKAYICKSAACPTYLIRDNKIIKIDGASLPIGIINEIQLDMYIVDIKINDYFLMISDGVEANEVEEWIKTTKEYKMKNDINTFINILENKQRKDASTILLALVK